MNLVKNLVRSTNMDIRLLFVFFPVLAAASWALYNIGRVALQQYKKIANS